MQRGFGSDLFKGEWKNSFRQSLFLFRQLSIGKCKSTSALAFHSILVLASEELLHSRAGVNAVYCPLWFGRYNRWCSPVMSTNTPHQDRGLPSSSAPALSGSLSPLSAAWSPVELETNLRFSQSTDNVPTRVSSWLKVPTSVFTFKTLLRHYAKWVLTHCK